MICYFGGRREGHQKNWFTNPGHPSVRWAAAPGNEIDLPIFSAMLQAAPLATTCVSRGAHCRSTRPKRGAFPHKTAGIWGRGCNYRGRGCSCFLGQTLQNHFGPRLKVAWSGNRWQNPQACQVAGRLGKCRRGNLGSPAFEPSGPVGKAVCCISVRRNSQMASGHGEERASSFLLAEFKGEPFPTKKKKGHRANWGGYNMSN